MAFHNGNLGKLLLIKLPNILGNTFIYLVRSFFSSVFLLDRFSHWYGI